MRILAVTNAPWTRSNSTGSTYSTIFENFKDAEIISVYCNVGQPDADAVVSAYQISTESLLQSMIFPETEAGRRVDLNQQTHTEAGPDNARRRLSHVLSGLRDRRFSFYPVAQLAQSAVWSTGRWRTESLRDFVKAAQPDVIFAPLYGQAHMTRMALFIRDLVDVPLIPYVADDIYTMRQVSFNPFFWAERVVNRRLIRRVLTGAPWLYVVSDVQKNEYERLLKIECRVLTKLGRFTDQRMPSLNEASEKGERVSFTYAGGVGNGRWKSLAAIGRAISRARRDGHEATLDVYTMTPLNKRMKRALTQDAIRMHSAVTPSELSEVYASSDVLVLAEPVDLQGRLLVHQSFSTKVVEYLEAGRPIFALGPQGAGTIRHLLESRAAMVSVPGDDLDGQIEALITSRSLRKDLASRGWELGKLKHDQVERSRVVQDEFLELIRDV